MSDAHHVTISLQPDTLDALKVICQVRTDEEGSNVSYSRAIKSMIEETRAKLGPPSGHRKRKKTSRN